MHKLAAWIISLETLYFVWTARAWFRYILTSQSPYCAISSFGLSRLYGDSSFLKHLIPLVPSIDLPVWHPVINRVVLGWWIFGGQLETYHHEVSLDCNPTGFLLFWITPDKKLCSEQTIIKLACFFLCHNLNKLTYFSHFLSSNEIHKSKKLMWSFYGTTMWWIFVEATSAFPVYNVLWWPLVWKFLSYPKTDLIGPHACATSIWVIIDQEMKRNTCSRLPSHFCSPCWQFVSFCHFKYNNSLIFKRLVFQIPLSFQLGTQDVLNVISLHSFWIHSCTTLLISPALLL